MVGGWVTKAYLCGAVVGVEDKNSSPGLVNEENEGLGCVCKEKE